MERDSDRDDALLEELRRVIEQVDPVPGQLLAAAQASLGWRTFDDDLAELLHDSSTEPALAGVRADDGGRVLSFAGEQLALEVEISGSGSERSLAGQVTPAGPGRIELRHSAGVLTVDTDERGRFSASGIPAGVASLRFRAAAAGTSRALVTPWLPI